MFVDGGLKGEGFAVVTFITVISLSVEVCGGGWWGLWVLTWLRLGGGKYPLLSFCSIKCPIGVGWVVCGLSVFNIKCPFVGGKYPFSVTKCPFGSTVVGGWWKEGVSVGGIYCLGCLSVVVVGWSRWPNGKCVGGGFFNGNPGNEHESKFFAFYNATF